MNSDRKGIWLLLASLCLAAPSFAADRKVAKSDLPPAVAKTAEEQSKGLKVTGYSEERENGKLEYEVQMTTDGHSKDVIIAPDGALIEIEEQVAMTALPTEVRSVLQSKAGQGKITKIESLTKHGAVVAYEAQIVTAGKHSEIQVGPNGQKLDHEE
jgi:hypothetical protein